MTRYNLVIVAIAIAKIANAQSLYETSTEHQIITDTGFIVPFYHRNESGITNLQDPLPLTMMNDIHDLVFDTVDYVTWEHFFSPDFLTHLAQEMHWLESHYEIDTRNSYYTRNYGNYTKDDYANYHRISSVYWLTYIKPEHHQYLPYTLRFKEWVARVREGVQESLPKGYEVGEIEEQYLYYDKGGRFEAHQDTNCNPLLNCQNADNVMNFTRLLTYIVYLNPNWTQSEGGELTLYTGPPNLEKRSPVQEVLSPTIGKAILFRSDKVWHQAEVVNGEKRAVTLFINIRPRVLEVIETDMDSEMQEIVIEIVKNEGTSGNLRQIAEYVKEEMDAVFDEGEAWSCVVAKEFGSAVSTKEEHGHFILQIIRKMTILQFLEILKNQITFLQYIFFRYDTLYFLIFK